MSSSDTSGDCSWGVSVNGTTVTAGPLELVVVRQLNRITTATLSFVDGSPSQNDFPLSSSGVLDPAAKIVLSAGYGQNNQTIFSGIIVGHRVVALGNRSRLAIDAKDAAFGLAIAPRHRLFTAATDSAIVSGIIGDHGLTASVASTSPQIEQVAQRDQTDWEFILSRMGRYGMAVSTEDGTVRIFTPKSGSAVDVGQYGQDYYEADLEVDARDQLKAASSTSWDYSTQAVTTKTGSEPAIPEPGSTSASTLAAAGKATLIEISNQLLASDVESALADGRLLENRIGMVKGRIRVRGRSDLTLGATVAIKGCGSRLSGNALLTGIRHQIVNGLWLTDLEFGRITSPATRGRTRSPESRQFAFGTVLQLSNDPNSQFRVKVSLPLLEDGTKGVWARVSTLFAGKNNASFFRPDVGDEVLVALTDDDTAEAVILGSLNSSKLASPLTSPDEANNLKEFKTRSGLTLSFDDGKKEIVASTPAGNSITLSDDGKSITLKDQHSNSLVMDGSGITISSASAMSLKAKTTLSAQAGSKLSASGVDVEISASGELKASGTGSTEVSSSGITKVQGSLVQLN